MADIRPIVKYHGGKGRLFKWIREFLPTHQTYCEPFGGAASLLLNKPRSNTEIYNDIEPTIVNLMTVVRDDFERFHSAVQEQPYEKENYLEHRAIYRSDEFPQLPSLERAVTTYVAKRMSRGGLCGSFSWSKRMYSTGPAEVHCWNTGLKNLVLVHERLQGVQIQSKNALEIIETLDGDEVLLYLDPPYLHSTRHAKNLYICEMTEAEHVALAEVCHRLRSRIVLSGYPSLLYEKLYGDWRYESKKAANHAAGKKKDIHTKEMMTECLWLNF